MKPTAEEVRDALENTNIAEVKSYSGRGMYGKECPAMDLEEIDEIAILFVMLTRDHPNLADWMARNVKLDNMGTGYVVYWPRASYEQAA